jgi:hypothetical protein
MTVYTFSAISVATYMFHFWFIDTKDVYPLWGISGAFAIFAIYSGLIRRSEIKDDPTKRGMVTAAAAVGCLVLLGLTLSAVMIIAPLHMSGLIQ